MLSRFFALCAVAALASCAGGGGSGSIASTPPVSGSGGGHVQGTIPVTYTITDLGVLSGYSQSYGNAINDAGTAVGWVCCSANPYATAINFSKGTLLNLTGLSGYDESQANAINGLGAAAGISAPSGTNSSIGNPHAVRFDGCKVTDLGVPQGYVSSTAYGINDSDVAVGFAQSNSLGYSAVEFANGNDTILGPGVAMAINDSGTIVGYSGSNAVFFLGNGNVQDMGSLISGGASTATAINAGGDVAGYGDAGLVNGQQVEHPFLYSGGTMHDLGLPSGGVTGTAAGINSTDVIVGSYITSGSTQHAFVWESGTYADLNQRVFPGSGWVFNNASGVNTSGQIVGTGTLNGQVHGFILTPGTSN